MAQLTPEEEQRLEDELEDEWEDDGSESPGAIILRKFGEIRKRVLIVLGTMFVAMCVILVYANRIFTFLLQPLCAAIPQNAAAPVGTVAGAAKQFGGCMLYPTDLLEPMVVLFKMSVLLALFATAPILFWQVWGIASGYVSKQVKGWAVVFVASATIFFVGGAAFGFFVVFPKAFAFLLSVAGANVVPLPTMASYFSLISMLLLGFGVSFELPLIMFLLSKVGVTNAAFYARYQRHAVFALMVFAAVITPTPDPVTMLSLAVPLMGLYYFGLLLSYLAGSSGPTLLEQRMKEMDMMMDDDDDEDEDDDDD